MVEDSIPEKTVMPIDFLAAAPAPDEVMSGTTPRMKANEVIKIGLNRRLEASSAALTMSMPCWCNSRATSTIKIAFFAESAIKSTSPI